jgi:hypothetical protein
MNNDSDMMYELMQIPASNARVSSVWACVIVGLHSKRLKYVHNQMSRYYPPPITQGMCAAL